MVFLGVEEMPGLVRGPHLRPLLSRQHPGILSHHFLGVNEPLCKNCPSSLSLAEFSAVGWSWILIFISSSGLAAICSYPSASAVFHLSVQLMTLMMLITVPETSLSEES